MSLNADDIAGIETLFSGGADDAGLSGEFRRRFPGLSLTRCDPSDVGDETPFRILQHYRLYLVDGSDHCWRLTDEADRATGLVMVRTGGDT